jgi:organic hydroperoxide reductase OsmC/OhrA
MNARHEYLATIEWQRDATASDFQAGRYSRRHRMRFDGGTVVPGSAAVANVPLPYADPAAVDPEEAFVASISSCHMLWFLALAAKSRFAALSYRDDAIGVMTNNELGKLWVSRVTLHPEVVFDGDHQPTREQLLALHHRAHEECFIANSVKTEVVCEPSNSANGP